jgi:hypothetical protein
MPTCLTTRAVQRMPRRWMAGRSPGMDLPAMPSAQQSCQGHSSESRMDSLPAEVDR